MGIEKEINKGILENKFTLVVDEPIDGVLNFDFIQKQWCSDLIERAETEGEWTDGRHEYYPTHDMLLKDLDPELNQHYVNMLDEHIRPMLVEHFALEGDFLKKDWYFECFIAKYSHDLQSKLDLHHDSADFASVLTLNENYDGGGTYFSRQKTLHKGNTGTMTVHPGKITHLHGGRPVTDGTRYILVSFINISD